MKVSEHFKQALFFDQNSATEAFFEERASALFVLKEAESTLEIAFQTPSQDEMPNISQCSRSYSVRTPGSAPKSSFESTSQGSRILRQNGYLQPQSGSEGDLKINCQKVQDVAKLSQIILVGFRNAKPSSLS